MMSENLKEGYQKTILGNLPSDWEVKKLGDNAYIKARIGWRGLSSKEYTEEGPYLIAGKHIKGSKIIWEKCDHISIERYEESAEIQLCEQDIIMSKDGTIGRVGFIDFLPGSATINGTMMLIRPDESLFSKYLYYYFQGSKFQSLISEKISGSSVPHIFQRDMVTLNIPVPPYGEQKKIADILISLDETIEKTEVILEKIEKVKQGLMQQLLTKGIGHIHYKKTHIGTIPEKWEIRSVGELCLVKGGKRIPKGESFSEEKTSYPYVRVSDFSNNSINIENLKYVTDEVRQKIKRYTISSEDVYISIAGIYLGIVGTVPKELDNALLTENAAKIVIKNKEIISKDYLIYVLESLSVREQIRIFSGVTGVPKLGLNKIEKIIIPIPPMPEQKKIVDIIKNCSRRIDKEKSTLKQFKIVKQGLMQLLFTGKVRVKVDEAEVTQVCPPL